MKGIGKALWHNRGTGSDAGIGEWTITNEKLLARCNNAGRERRRGGARYKCPDRVGGE